MHDTPPTLVHLEPPHTMATREPFVSQGLMVLEAMEAHWQEPSPHGVSLSNIDANTDANLGVNASFGHVADVATPGARGFVTMPLHAPLSSDSLQQEGSTLLGMEGDQQTMEISVRGASGVLSVQIFDSIRCSTIIFLTSFQVEIVAAGRESREIQFKIFQRKAPMTRGKCAHERDNHIFSELRERLRKAGGFAVGPHDVPDRGRRFLLAPLGNDLLGTVLPVADIEDLCTQRSESGRTVSRVAVQNQVSHSGWPGEHTFTVQMTPTTAVTSPHLAINREQLSGRWTDESAVGLNDIGQTSNFGGYFEPVDQVDAHAMRTPSTDLETTEEVDMDTSTDWGSDGDS